MYLNFSDDSLGSIFAITGDLQKDEVNFENFASVNRIVWNRNKESIKITIDELEISLDTDQIITLNNYQKIQYPENCRPLTGIIFNREFYCTTTHDDEVSCNGILFFGTSDIPIITIPKDQCRKFELLWEVIKEEMEYKDKVQGDMLQMLLKRFIIITTRLAKVQMNMEKLNDKQIETIREFIFLVDIHFKEKKKVNEYAELMFKSPKTLSNIFSIYDHKTPQQIIQERVVLEAKRLIKYTDKQTQEIAFELGFEDPAHFSRYFKKIAGVSPSEYKGK